MNNVEQIIKEKNKELYKLPKPLSVSKCIEYIKEQFDKEAKAKDMVDKHYNEEDSPYYHKTAEEIIEMWDNKATTSRSYGSNLDDYIGMNLNEQLDELSLWKLDHNFYDDKRLNGICTGFDQYYKLLQEKTDYQYVTRELTLYIKSNKGNYIRGRFDCLFYSPLTDRYLIIDWKNTEKIFGKSNYRKKMLGPCFKMDECNLNEYTLQTHFYKKALCETYGITTYDKVDCYICQMLPEALENGNHFLLHKQNFSFEPEFLNKVIDYCVEKDKIVNKEQ